MKMFTRLLVVIAIISLGTAAFGQIKRATRQMNLFKYSKAVKTLTRAVSGKDSLVKQQALLKLADCYRLQNNVPKAREYYEKSFKAGNTDTLSYLYYAQTLRSMGEYDAAKSAFLKYSSLRPGDVRGWMYASFCDSVRIWAKKHPGFEIRNIAILNSPQGDFCPVFYDKGLLFSSDRNNRVFEYGSYPWTGNSYVGLFYAPFKKEGECFDYNEPKLSKGLFNKGFHNGPITFDNDFNQAYVTQTTIYKTKEIKGPGKKRIHLLKIFYSDKKKDKFRSMKPFFLNSDSYSVGHPALSPDGKMLWFISDMDGGKGGTDLWYCVNEKGVWSQPFNAGPEINTPENEMFPFIASNGDLYFSSTGLPGYGGLDIFMARKKGDSWGKPVNLGAPVNSSWDDFGMLACKDSINGLFASNRPGGMGSDDIYTSRRIPLPPDTALVTLCVKDKETRQPVPGATLFILNEATGKVKVLKAGPDGCVKTWVKIGPAHNARAMFPSYYSGFMPFQVREEDTPETVSAPRTIYLEKVPVPPPRITIGNIYYDFDKSNIRKDAQPVLDSLAVILKDNSVRVDLASFTDCRGSKEYNQALSDRRAASAVKYLVGKGVDPARITAAGYGENNPVNKCVDGVPCTAKEYQANRRTEFKLIYPPLPVVAEPVNPDQYKDGEKLDLIMLPPGFFRSGQ